MGHGSERNGVKRNRTSPVTTSKKGRENSSSASTPQQPSLNIMKTNLSNAHFPTTSIQNSNYPESVSMLTSDDNISTIHTRSNSVSSLNSITLVQNQSNKSTFRLPPIFVNKPDNWRTAAPIIYDNPDFTSDTVSAQANAAPMAPLGLKLQ